MQLDGALQPEREAILDPGHRARVNHETYFFAADEARQEFTANALTHCGVVTDPITNERFLPTEQSPRLDYNGRPYFFISEETRSAFEADPSAHADAKREMMKKMKMDE